MLLEPTNKYIDHNFRSKHYLNCPKHMFNSNVNDLVRGYTTEKATANLRDMFTYYGYPLKNLAEIVEYHQNIHVQEFNKLNVNPYIDKTPPHIEARSRYIDGWVKCNTQPATYRNPYPTTPSFPFLY